MNEPTKQAKQIKKRTIVSGVPKPRTIDQLSMARMIAQKYRITVSWAKSLLSTFRVYRLIHCIVFMKSPKRRLTA